MTAWRGTLWVYLELFFSTPERATATFTAVFTAVLAISTIGLWRSTRKLWRVIRITAEHIPNVERAYISGGAGFTTRTLASGDIQIDTSRLLVTINNYGKTPAFIGTVAAATCDKLEPKFSGPWQRQEWKGYVLRAPTRSLLSDVGCKYETGKIIFGRPKKRRRGIIIGGDWSLDHSFRSSSSRRQKLKLFSIINRHDAGLLPDTPRLRQHAPANDARLFPASRSLHPSSNQADRDRPTKGQIQVSCSFRFHFTV
jgi:hypothetical protein